MRQGDLEGEGLSDRGVSPLLIHLLIWDDRNRNGVLMSGSKAFSEPAVNKEAAAKGVTERIL